MGIAATTAVLRAARCMPFHYSRIAAVVISLPLEAGCVAHIVGDPDNAAYEFVILDGDRVIARSDDGYGNHLSALRDALITHCGMPQRPLI